MKNLARLAIVLFLAGSSSFAQEKTELEALEELEFIPPKSGGYVMQSPKAITVAGDRLYVYQPGRKILLFDKNLKHMATIEKDIQFFQREIDWLQADQTGRILMDKEKEWILIDGEKRRIPKRFITTVTLLKDGYLYVPLAYQKIEQGDPLLRKISLWGVQEEMICKTQPEMIADIDLFACTDIKDDGGNIYLLPQTATSILRYNLELDQQQVIPLEIPAKYTSDVEIRRRFHMNRLAIGKNKIFLGIIVQNKSSVLLTFDNEGKHLSTEHLNFILYRMEYLKGTSNDKLIFLSYPFRTISNRPKVYFKTIEK